MKRRQEKKCKECAEKAMQCTLENLDRALLRAMHDVDTDRTLRSVTQRMAEGLEHTLPEVTYILKELLEKTQPYDIEQENHMLSEIASATVDVVIDVAREKSRLG